jgi:hypothetical protein
MLGTTTQTRFAEATAELLSVCAQAGTRLAHASADQGIAIWAQALQVAARRADARLDEWRGAFLPWWDLGGAIMGGPNAGTCEEPGGSGLPSYRTSSGHASAQVVTFGGR